VTTAVEDLDCVVCGIKLYSNLKTINTSYLCIRDLGVRNHRCKKRSRKNKKR